jgi:hypothetical protein
MTDILDTQSTLQAGLLHLMSNGIIEDQYLRKEKESNTLYNLKIDNDIETNIASHGDIIEFDYLIINNCDNAKLIDTLTLITIRYDETYIINLPKFLIKYLILIHNVKATIHDNKLIVPLNFLPKIIDCDKAIIKFNFVCNTTLDLQLFMTRTFINKKNDMLVKYPYYQFIEEDITNDTFKNIIHFTGLGTNLIIHSEHIDKIKSIEISLNGLLYLCYDQLCLQLYAKKYPGNYMEIFYDHKNNEDYHRGINYSRTDRFKVNIGFDSSINNKKIYFATKTYNEMKLYDNRPIVSFQMPYNIMKIWYNHFSLTKISDKSFIEGYWYDGDPTHPVPRELDYATDDAFIAKLEVVNDCINNGQSVLYGRRLIYKHFMITEISYMGFSNCRICDVGNGHTELSITNDNDVTFTYPSGLMHYFKNHKIHPSPEFREFIIDLDLTE